MDFTTTAAQKEVVAATSISATTLRPNRTGIAAVKVGDRVSPWLKLQVGQPLGTTFHGNERAISALRSNPAEPTSQTSVDINADGYADLIAGFRTAEGGGLISLHRASRQAFEPTDAQVLADLRRGVFPAAFERDAIVREVPTAPDFIVAGKFSEGSAVDLVFASRGGSSIYLMTSDGRGGFIAPQEIDLGGEITALASEKIDFSKSYTGVVAAVSSGKSSKILVFSGREELINSAPESIDFDGRIDSLILAKRNFSNAPFDLFGIADGRIITVSDIAKAKGGVETIDLPFRAVDFAIGEFIRDRQGKAEIAVLSESGTVSYLKQGTLDTRPFTEAEMRELFRGNGGRGNPYQAEPETNNALGGWTEAETQQLGVNALGESAPRVLRKAYLTGYETEDLLVMDSQAKSVKVLFKEPHKNKNRTAFTRETKIQNVDFADAPAAVLPMRLNVMGQQGFVVFGQGSLEPATVMLGPGAMFTVTTTTDENNGACSSAGTGCSLREAVIAANNTAGADMITFGLNGTFQLTITGANENASATGDLDIRDAVTITGNGTGNTIIQAGTNTTNGIDKVFSVNPLFNAPFASSFTGMTMRYGRNPSPFGGDGHGGGMDWDGSGTGTLNISNTIIDQNSTTDGRGGGIAIFNNGSGTTTISNTTVSNNLATRPSGAAAGGGIFVSFGAPLAMTTVVIDNNSTTSASTDGGGLFMFALNNTGGSSTFSNITITNNDATNDGGGMLTQRGLTINPPFILNNNTTTRWGGGMSMTVFMTSVNISEATMVGNSAGTSGGAIEVGAQTVANGNILNMSFSRIVGNTGGGFNGLVTRGGAANVENNWWGCNTGPSATPCDRAGLDTAQATGTLDFDPWLQLRLTASPNTTPIVGESRSLTASFLLN